MAQQPPEKKMDISSLPRGAIGIKGLPISRNTRLPSIRSPRDLTLGAPPKRTFMPNIPPRREKKPPASDTVSVKLESEIKLEHKNVLPQNDRGRGRGRGKAQIIQTAGSIFGEGIAADTLSRKEKYQKSEYSVPSRTRSIKKEKEDEDEDIARVSREMDDLLRDDFIDDDEEDDDDIARSMKPIFFPPTANVKKEVKPHDAKPAAKVEVDPSLNFSQDIAKEMGFDVKEVAKFIKKEKGTDVDEKENIVIPSTDVSSHPVVKMLNEESPELMLLQFPQYFTLPQKMDDSQPESYHKGQSSTGSKTSGDQKTTPVSISSLPEGRVGKLQVLKSGRVRLLIGSQCFYLDSIDSLESKHEVASVRTDTSGGDMAVLGAMKQKVKFVPSFNNLSDMGSLLS